MNKYFIQLFLKENTVILPGFGALTAPNGNIEEIMFLPYLKTDDGKLAKFIVNTEGIALQDAQNTIAKFIREMETNLSKGESFDIFQFGSFFKNEDGEVEFSSSMKQAVEKKPAPKKKKTAAPKTKKEIKTPKVDKNDESKKDIPLVFDTKSIKEAENIVEKPIEKIEHVTEDDKITFAPIIDDSKSKERNEKIEEPEKTLKEEKKTILPIINTSETVKPKEEEKKKKSKAIFWLVGLLALIAISIGIYVLFGDQLKKLGAPELAQTEKKKEPEKEPVKEQEKKIKATKQKKKPEETDNLAQKEMNTEPIVAETTKGYYLISGVYKTTEQAQTKIDKLTKDGISGKILQEGPKKFYVSLADFTERNPATEKLIELRSKGIKAWVLEK